MTCFGFTSLEGNIRPPFQGKSFSVDARDGIIYMTVEPYGPTIAHNYQSYTVKQHNMCQIHHISEAKFCG